MGRGQLTQLAGLPVDVAPQVRRDDPRVQAKCMEALLAQLLGQGERHEHVGRLGLAVGGPPVVGCAVLVLVVLVWLPMSDVGRLRGWGGKETHIKVVVVETDGTHPVPIAGNVHHPRCLTLKKPLHDQVRE